MYKTHLKFGAFFEGKKCVLYPSIYGNCISSNTVVLNLFGGTEPQKFRTCIHRTLRSGRAANSHALGVSLTYWRLISRSHAHLLKFYLISSSILSYIMSKIISRMCKKKYLFVFINFPRTAKPLILTRRTPGVRSNTG